VSSGGVGFLNSNTGAAVLAFAAAQDSATSTLNFINTVVAGNSVPACGTIDAGPTFGLNGTATPQLVSQGGNLSSDASCNPYFNQSTDQNNLTALNTTLGSLSNNGGFVPTRALLQGSPAIDSGITVAGLTTDARLAARPQGSAFDSGAYESTFTEPKASLAATGQNATYIMAFALLATTLGSVILVRRYEP
jgi:hypothetical protein